MNILAIDPSIIKTGWAVFKEGKHHKSGVVRSKVIKGKTSLNDAAYKTIQILDELKKELFTLNIRNINLVVIESPGPFSYARSKGHNNNDLRKLTLCIGMIYSEISRYVSRVSNIDQAGVYIELIQADKWKGKSSKKLSKILASAIAGFEIKSDDEADAICLGSFVIKQARIMEVDGETILNSSARA